MVSCSIKGCRSRTSSGVKFFRFPIVNEIREQWLACCNVENPFNVDNARICSLHFTEEDWSMKDILMNTPFEKRRLKPGVVPTQNLPTSSQSNSSKSIKIMRKKCIEISSFKTDFSKTLKNSNVKKVDVSTQTVVNVECSTELLIRQLEKKYRSLKKTLHEAKDGDIKFNRVNENLAKLFTKGQIKKLLTPNKRVVWSKIDIAAAFGLYSTGSRAYRFLYNKGYPIPAPSTIRKCSFRINFESGIINSILDIMAKRSLSDLEKLCVLSIDKIKIKPLCVSDDDIDALNTAEFVQVAVAGGVFDEWKQLVYFEYDRSIDAVTLNDIIKKLYGIGYTVVAVVSALDQTNQVLWDELGVNYENVCFVHPSNVLKRIYVFSDVFQLIKLLRNQFLDTGFQLGAAKIDANLLRDLLTTTSLVDIEKNCLVTETHLNIQGAAREKLKYAVELFSNSVSNAIRILVKSGNCNNEYALQYADFIEIVFKWFKLFTTQSRHDGTDATTRAFGLALEDQTIIISTMNEIALDLKIPDYTTMIPFQTGILWSNESLLGLHSYLQTMYGISSFTTYKFSIDFARKMFSSIYEKGSLNSNPNIANFRYWLKSYLLNEGVEAHIESSD